VPLEALHVPVTRTNPAASSTQPWNIAQAITENEALTFYTRNVAYQMFREDERGSLEVGKIADFLLLDDTSILAICSQGELLQVHV
jgi:hypothetical protein